MTDKYLDKGTLRTSAVGDRLVYLGPGAANLSRRRVLVITASGV